jgi:CubicO group peptidase (beta-lactamase class C family)
MSKRSRFAALLFVVLGISIAVAQSARSEQPENRVIAAKLQPMVDGQTMAGAVTLVASKDKVLDLETVGYADIAAKKEMAPDDLFWIASMSKGMTAAAMMMLVDEGKVNVDDPVEKYLPEFHGQMVEVEQDENHVVLKKPEHPIKIREILSHTSGLPFMSRIEGISHHIDTMPLSEAVITYAMSPLNFEPGTKFSYSNAGINTGGRIVEVVSGMPYEKFMQERLFDPLGMKDTTFFPTDEQLQRLAKSYRHGADNSGLQELPIEQLTYPLDAHNRFPSPAGGLFSTATDVGLFCQMLLNGGTFQGKHYLSAAAVQQMSCTQTDEILSHPPAENGYGFGFFTSKKVQGEPVPGSGGVFGHGGAYSTNMDIDPQHELVKIFMVQSAGAPGPHGHMALPVFQKAADEAFAK